MSDREKAASARHGAGGAKSSLERFRVTARQSRLGPVLRPIYRLFRAWDFLALAAGLLLAIGALIVAASGGTQSAVTAVAAAFVLVALSLQRRLMHQQRTAEALTRELARFRADAEGLPRSRDPRQTVLEGIERMQRRQHKQAIKQQQRQTQQVEALLELYARVKPTAPMPPAGLTALNPNALLELWHLVQQARPGLVVELGSGTSTVWIGYALAEFGGRLVSVEHDSTYAEVTRQHVRRHGLEQHVEVRDAPLSGLELGERKFVWYDANTFADLSGIEFLLVDGPPGNTCPHARLPALPVLEERLAPRCTVILDDARRTDEQEILESWEDSVKTVTREPGTQVRMAVLTYERRQQ